MQRREFVCEGYRFASDTGTLSLHYAFDGGPRFEERIALPPATRLLSDDEHEALHRVFRLLLLACGVSYYKAFAPRRIRCAAFLLEPATAAFFTDFYVKGLAEFAWRNGIDLAGLSFATEAVEAASALLLNLPRLTCVPVGGGKDSIVTIECLKQAAEPLVLFELGDAAPIEATIAQAGLPAIRVTRRLDPALFALNEAGALNGHVPITGILSMLVLACAIIRGFDVIAMSNEHSASAPNLVAEGREVNHQVQQVVRIRACVRPIRGAACGAGRALLLPAAAAVGDCHRATVRAPCSVSSRVPQLQCGVPPVGGAQGHELVLRLSEVPLRLSGAGAIR